MARKLGVQSGWLKSEADAGRLPHLKAGERYLFEPTIVVSILVERAKEKKKFSKVAGTDFGSRA